MSVRRRSQLHLIHDAVRRGRRRDAPSFGLQYLASGDRHTLVLRGELDLASAPALSRALAQIPLEAGTSVVLDLRALEFIDSTGVCATLVINTVCAERGCELSFIPGSERVQRVYELCGLLDHLPFRGEGAADLSDPPAAI